MMTSDSVFKDIAMQSNSIHYVPTSRLMWHQHVDRKYKKRRSIAINVQKINTV